MSLARPLAVSYRRVRSFSSAFMTIQSRSPRSRLDNLVGQKVIDGGQEERSEAAGAAIDGLQVMLADQPGKEFLSQFLAVRRRIASATNIVIERIPIRPAELFQSGRGMR